MRRDVTVQESTNTHLLQIWQGTRGCCCAMHAGHVVRAVSLSLRHQMHDSTLMFHRRTFSDLSPNEAHVNITLGEQRRGITKYAPGSDLRSGRSLCCAAACVLLKTAEEGRCWSDHALRLSGVITVPQKSGLSCNLTIDHQRQRSSISHTPSSRGCQGRWEATAADTRRCIPRGGIHSCRDSRLSCATPPRRELHTLEPTAASWSITTSNHTALVPRRSSIHVGHTCMGCAGFPKINMALRRNGDF